MSTVKVTESVFSKETILFQHDADRFFPFRDVSAAIQLNGICSVFIKRVIAAPGSAPLIVPHADSRTCRVTVQTQWMGIDHSGEIFFFAIFKCIGEYLISRFAFFELGGEKVSLVPSLNGNERWFSALAELCR